MKDPIKQGIESSPPLHWEYIDASTIKLKHFSYKK